MLLTPLPPLLKRRRNRTLLLLSLGEGLSVSIRERGVVESAALFIIIHDGIVIVSIEPILPMILIISGIIVVDVFMIIEFATNIL